MPIVEEYFGQLPTAPKPTEPYTIEPPQNSVREVNLQEIRRSPLSRGLPSAQLSRSRTTSSMTPSTDILSNGRTSRLYRSLVRDKQIAAFAAGFSGFPGTKYAHLFAFYGVPFRDIPTPSCGRFSRADHQAEDARRDR